jgi:hypothetical protein
VFERRRIYLLCTILYIINKGEENEELLRKSEENIGENNLTIG